MTIATNAPPSTRSADAARPSPAEQQAPLTGEDLLGDLDPGWLDWRREQDAA